MEKRITIKDIARLSGVGISTVSRVINNRDDVNDETRRKVLAVVAKYGYEPNNNAKHLKQASSNYIAIIIRGTQNIFFSSIVELLQTHIEAQGYHYLMRYIDEFADEYAAARNVYSERKVNGIIFLGGSVLRHTIIPDLPAIPCVFATFNASGIKLNNVFSVSIDDRLAAKTAIDTLLNLGHEKIAVLGGALDLESPIALRYQGIIESYQERGMQFNDALYLTSSFSLSSAYTVMEKALKSGKHFTGVFAMSDIMAIGAAKALMNYGKHIPNDVSLIGFDGIELAQYITPALASMRQPGEEIASESIRLLLQGINGEAQGVHITLKSELIQSASIKKLK